MAEKDRLESQFQKERALLAQVIGDARTQVDLQRSKEEALVSLQQRLAHGL